MRFIIILTLFVLILLVFSTYSFASSSLNNNSFSFNISLIVKERPELDSDISFFSRNIVRERLIVFSLSIMIGFILVFLLGGKKKI